jgi:ubiquinone/menaquinone biosynthesis C-methylase UbiE
MRAEGTKNPDMSVGSSSRDHWMDVGKLQFDYLVKHGLRPNHSVLEIGCGNLRAGWRLIRYLHPGKYYGIDISPDILLAALKTVEDFGLQHKLPHLVVVENLRFSYLPDQYFDIVHAHSVFSHAPIDVLDECLKHVGRVMKPSGFFDFTWLQSNAGSASVLGEDFYFPRERIVELAHRHGFNAQEMGDWVYVQPKLRLRAASSRGA